MKHHDDELEELAKRLRGLLRLRVGIFPPDWMLGEYDDDESGAWGRAVNDVVRPLWNRAREIIEREGYAGLKVRLEDHGKDGSEAAAAAALHEDHARYFRRVQMECLRMAREHGTDTKTAVTATELWKKMDGDLWQALHDRGWMVSATQVGEGPIQPSMSYHPPQNAADSWGIKNLPPGPRAHFVFRRETWEKAVELVEIEEKRSGGLLVEAERRRELTEFHVAVINGVLRQDRLAGKAEIWTAGASASQEEETRRGHKTGREYAVALVSVVGGYVEDKEKPIWKPYQKWTEMQHGYDSPTRLFEQMDDYMEKSPGSVYVGLKRWSEKGVTVPGVGLPEWPSTAGGGDDVLEAYIQLAAEIAPHFVDPPDRHDMDGTG